MRVSGTAVKLGGSRRQALAEREHNPPVWGQTRGAVFLFLLRRRPRGGGWARTALAYETTCGATRRSQVPVSGDGSIVIVGGANDNGGVARIRPSRLSRDR
jgi:hypothetical protein